MKNKCCDSHLNEKKARELLSKNGMNRTKIKVDVLRELSKSQKPMSVTEIHQEMGDNCDISTIFRTISQFKEKNMVREINLSEGFFRYEIINPDQDETHHHHHVRCRNCGEIELIGKCDLSAIEKAISKLGFKNTQHSLEFTGICSRCS